MAKVEHGEVRTISISRSSSTESPTPPPAALYALLLSPSCSGVGLCPLQFLRYAGDVAGRVPAVTSFGSCSPPVRHPSWRYASMPAKASWRSRIPRSVEILPSVLERDLLATEPALPAPRALACPAAFSTSSRTMSPSGRDPANRSNCLRWFSRSTRSPFFRCRSSPAKSSRARFALRNSSTNRSRRCSIASSPPSGRVSILWPAHGNGSYENSYQVARYCAGSVGCPHTSEGRGGPQKQTLLTLSSAG